MKGSFSLRTVRKKVLMLSKLAGAALIVSYIFCTGLPVSGDASLRSEERRVGKECG